MGVKYIITDPSVAKCAQCGMQEANAKETEAKMLAEQEEAELKRAAVIKAEEDEASAKAEAAAAKQAAEAESTSGVMAAMEEVLAESRYMLLKAYGRQGVTLGSPCVSGVPE